MAVSLLSVMIQFSYATNFILFTAIISGLREVYTIRSILITTKLGEVF